MPTRSEFPPEKIASPSLLAGGRAVRLGDRARAAIRLRHLSQRTKEAYVQWMHRYYEFHGRQHPAALGAAHVTSFLNDLAVRRGVAASTQNQALAALVFLYREVLGRDLPWLAGLVRAKPSTRLPVVLSRDEMQALLNALSGLPKLAATLLYGSGFASWSAARCASRTSTGAEAAGPQRPEHHDDLHPRAEPRRGTSDEPAGRALGRL